MKARLELTNKRLDDMNGYLVDQSGRIDGLNKRIDVVRDEPTKKIDGTNNRMDQITFQMRESLTGDGKDKKGREDHS